MSSTLKRSGKVIAGLGIRTHAQYVMSLSIVSNMMSHTWEHLYIYSIYSHNSHVHLHKIEIESTYLITRQRV